MAQTGYTPIQLYRTATPAAAPVALNLLAGEIAINTADGKLFYKDASNNVQVIATKDAAAGTFTNIAYTGTLTGGTGVINIGSGQIYKDAAGNLGLGTATPASRLHVLGDLQIPAGNSLKYSVNAYITPEDNSIGARVSSPGAFTVWTGSTPAERFRINDLGNVGIGTSSPGAKLDVAGTVQTSSGYYVNGNAGGGFLFVKDNNALRFGTNDTERARIDSSGNVLVGSTVNNPQNAAKLYVSGSFSGGGVAGISVATSSTSNAIQIGFHNPNGAVGTINTSGTSTSYGTSSDYRLKNIEGELTDSGSYIDSLRPVHGTWKVDGSKFIGLIAHEVQEISQTQVATGTKDEVDADGNPVYQGMDYSNAELIANLIAEVQSLRKRVAQLEGA